MKKEMKLRISKYDCTVQCPYNIQLPRSNYYVEIKSAELNNDLYLLYVLFILIFYQISSNFYQTSIKVILLRAVIVLLEIFLNFNIV